MAVCLGYGVQSSHYCINVLHIAVIIREILQTADPICQVPMWEKALEEPYGSLPWLWCSKLSLLYLCASHCSDYQRNLTDSRSYLSSTYVGEGVQRALAMVFKALITILMCFTLQ